MIRYLKHNEIDTLKWDDCIAKSANGIIYAYSWYLDIVCPNWEALVEGDYEFLMPLTKRVKYGMSYLFPPYFTQQLGVFSEKNISENKVMKFLNSIPSEIKLFDINLNTKNQISTSEVIVTKNLTHELNLNSSYENIFKSYSENTKRNLKKAERNKLIIINDISLEDVINMFRRNRGRKISNLKSKDYETLKILMRECTSRNKFECVGIKTTDRKLCAGAFFIESNDKWIFIFSAANDTAKNNGAMFLLIDSFIKKYSKKNYILDFEGSNNKTLARFYKSFGSKETVYLQVKKNNLPILVRWLKR